MEGETNMPLLSAGTLATLLADKSEWAGRSKVVDDLNALETATPFTPVELPESYDLADVVEALVALGLATVAGSS
jgi:hypothetical protein